jgi:hypothetical protein
MNRAFVTLLAVVVALVTLAAPSAAVAGSIDDTGDDTTRPTVNEFFPEQRPLSDCLGALPKPNCGSEARGGWAQTTVFLSIVAGLGFIAWRIVAASRRARRERDAVTPETPASTTVPDDSGGGRAP